MSAADTVFLDTNVLVYAHDRSELAKGPKAHLLLTQLLAAGKPHLSLQVLSEFYWVVTRKISAPLTHAEAVAGIQRFIVLTEVSPLTWQVFERALSSIAIFSIPLWDAQILAAAKLQGATTILSEDFQHRGALDGVTFLNPFAADFDISEVLAP